MDAVEGEGMEATKFGFRTILDVIIEVLLTTQCLFYGSVISYNVEPFLSLCCHVGIKIWI